MKVMSPTKTAAAVSALERVLMNAWPALLVMAAIFALSSRPASSLPNLGWADAVVKKGGHVLGYAVLATCYWKALEWKRAVWWLAWLMAGAYGVTDELHQVLVAGRHASAWDIVLFDAPGPLLGLWIAAGVRRSRMTARA